MWARSPPSGSITSNGVTPWVKILRRKRWPSTDKLLRDQKLLRWQPDGRLFMTNALVWRFGVQVWQAGMVVQRFGQARQQAIAADPTEAVVIPPELEAAAYHPQKAGTKPLGIARSWLFMVTLGLFLLSFHKEQNAWGLNPWMLAAVVGFPEAGHALVMGRLGYGVAYALRTCSKRSRPRRTVRNGHRLQLVCRYPPDGRNRPASPSARSPRGRLQEAIALYSQAIALLPEDPNPYRRRGQWFAPQQNWTRAIADADTVLAQHPDDIVALSLRAEARQQSGDLAGAKQDRDRLRAVARSKQPPW